MNLADIRRGDTLRLTDGVLATALAPSRDGQWIRVRYTRAPGYPGLEGTEDLCAAEEITEITAHATHATLAPYV